MTDKMQSLALAPVGNLDSYIRAANAWPMLSADEERALAEKLHYHGDLEAAKTLILSHLRFVVHIARNYAGYGLPQADLIQEGNIGLMKAVRRFNPEVGVRLVSFAVHWIKAEIHEYVLRGDWRFAGGGIDYCRGPKNKNPGLSSRVLCLIAEITLQWQRAIFSSRSFPADAHAQRKHRNGQPVPATWTCCLHPASARG